MIIDISTYNKFKPILIEKAYESGIERAVEIGVASFIPIIAIYIYLEHEFGGFTDKIAEIMDFYQYDKVIGELEE